jgi:hypothetical protein
MGAGGSIPATEEEAKAAGHDADIITVYKFCTGYKDGTSKDHCAEGAELAYPGAPPFPVDFMMGITTKFGVSFPDWQHKVLGITKNEDGTYTTLEQQCIGAMKADMPAIEGTPFPAVAVAEIPEESKGEINMPVEVGVLTLVDGKVTKGVFAGEIKEGVEGAAEPHAGVLADYKAGNGGFGAVYKMLGKPLPAPPAEEAAAAPAE